MDAKVIRASHRNRSLHLTSLDRQRQTGSAGSTTSVLASSKGSRGRVAAVVVEDDDEREYFGEGRETKREQVKVVSRPVDVVEGKKGEAREVQLEALITSNPTKPKIRDSYEVIRPPQSRVIALSDSVPQLGPTPVSPVIVHVDDDGDEEWERIGMDGEVEAAPAVVTEPEGGGGRNWAAVVMGVATRGVWGNPVA